jgi:hypothetical protein
MPSFAALCLLLNCAFRTSVYGDSEAPYRLANLNAQRRSVGMNTCCHISCTEALSGDPLSSGVEMEHSYALPRKCPGR